MLLSQSRSILSYVTLNLSSFPWLFSCTMTCLSLCSPSFQSRSREYSLRTRNLSRAAFVRLYGGGGVSWTRHYRFRKQMKRIVSNIHFLVSLFNTVICVRLSWLRWLFILSCFLPAVPVVRGQWFGEFGNPRWCWVLCSVWVRSSLELHPVATATTWIAYYFNQYNCYRRKK